MIQGLCWFSLFTPQIMHIYCLCPSITRSFCIPVAFSLININICPAIQKMS